MSHPEVALTVPFTTEQLAIKASEELERNRYMVKLAMAALIINNEGEVLVATHEGRDGEFEQGALGAAMETYRYVPERSRTTTETPLEVLQRCMLEELLDECPKRFNAAGLYFDWQQPVRLTEWSAGPQRNFNDMFGVVTNLIVRVSNPKELEVNRRRSKEILHAEFRPISHILASNQPKRPGYDAWLIAMQHQLHARATTQPRPISWQKGPDIGSDVRFPFTGDVSEQHA